ncbi:hypothetical protein RJI84_01550 [Buchnera aphidicola (Chaitoregma tattakana)]|uniref:hypothetical protein n=1 Tax=Buchnera aphidicola TaxID=9 RepID=UPI0031B877C0
MIIFFSIVQLIIHFSIFLHIKDAKSSEYYNIFVVMFSLIIIFIIFFGSRSIMLSLHNKIMISEI